MHIWGYWYFSWKSWFQLVLHPVQHFAWCTLHISRVIIYSIDVLLSQFWTILLIPCSVLTIASWRAYRFLRMQVRWSDIPISLRMVHSFLWSTQSMALAYLMKQMIFWHPLAFLWSKKINNLISDFSAFSQSSLNIWKFLVHVLLRPSLENFEHYFASHGMNVIVW